MSDVGVMLVFGCILLIMLALIRFFAWLTELQEKHGSLGQAGVNTIKRYAAPRARVMSRSEDRTKPVPDPMVPVPLPGTWLDTGEIAINLTEDQILEVLALARNAKGKYLYSGKKIYALVGGNYGRFLATMRRLRDDDNGDMPDEPVVRTPIAGRPTSAKFETDADYPYHPIEG